MAVAEHPVDPAAPLALLDEFASDERSALISKLARWADLMERAEARFDEKWPELADRHDSTLSLQAGLIRSLVTQLEGLDGRDSRWRTPDENEAAFAAEAGVLQHHSFGSWGPWTDSYVRLLWLYGQYPAVFRVPADWKNPTPDSNDHTGESPEVGE